MKYVSDGKICTMKDAPVHTLEERIQRMEDTEAIKGIMYHYTRCTDNLDAGRDSSYVYRKRYILQSRFG